MLVNIVIKPVLGPTADNAVVITLLPFHYRFYTSWSILGRQWAVNEASLSPATTSLGSSLIPSPGQWSPPGNDWARVDAWPLNYPTSEMNRDLIGLSLMVWGGVIPLFSSFYRNEEVLLAKFIGETLLWAVVYYFRMEHALWFFVRWINVLLCVASCFQLKRQCGRLSGGVTWSWERRAIHKTTITTCFLTRKMCQDSTYRIKKKWKKKEMEKERTLNERGKER